MTARRVLLLGGTSEIGLAIVRELQRRGPCEVMLAGRDSAALADAAGQLTALGCPRVLTSELDALAVDTHATAVAGEFEALGGVDVVILAVGILGERGGLPADIDGALDVLQVNVVGASSLLIHAAERLRNQGGGRLVVLSSVAGERARASNAVYGASKAGLDALATGLGDALADDGVRILIVRPGFVHTRMTKGLPAAPLSTTPEAVANVVVGALDGRRRIVWAPASLRPLMAVLRLLPAPIFRRLPL